MKFDNIDVLVIDRIGKNISGEGADPNVTGRGFMPDVYKRQIQNTGNRKQMSFGRIISILAAQNTLMNSRKKKVRLKMLD